MHVISSADSEKPLFVHLAPEHANELWLNCLSYPEVSKYEQANIHNVEDVEMFIRSATLARRLGKDLLFGIQLEASQTIIGYCGLSDLSNDNYELWYFIGPPWWNKGYATEAANWLIDYAKCKYHATRVCAVCDVDNAASQRVLEKAGMCFVGNDTLRWRENEYLCIRRYEKTMS